VDIRSRANTTRGLDFEHMIKAKVLDMQLQTSYFSLSSLVSHTQNRDNNNNNNCKVIST
jgi:hypothetical protein